MKKLLLLFFVLALNIFPQTNIPYKDSKLPVDKRVEDLLARMTLEEKIDLLGGTGFATKPNSRLGIPELRMTDGPVGVRWGKSTAFPVSIAMAATWNPELVNGIGAAIGRETKGHARHVILGPCVNIVRIPQGGRNFESFGEDPYLTSRMVVPYIQGVQKEGVAATVKHFAANNQEEERMYADVMITDRALNEIYLPSFKAAVQEADVLTVMCSYNKLNHKFASENDYLLNDKLKREWGFKGLVMSDWGAVHSSLPVARGGLDLEMPTGKFLNKTTLLLPVQNGAVPLSTIEDKVKRILTVIFKLGLFDNPEWKENPSLINSEDNKKIAYETSKASIVLLKNEQNILPLKQETLKTLAIIGPNAAFARTGGGGSAYVDAIDPVSPIEGLKSRLAKNVKIEYSQGVTFGEDIKSIEPEFLFTDQSQKQNGLNAEYYDNKNLGGDVKFKRVDKNIDFKFGDGGPGNGIGDDNFSIRWSGYVKAPETGEFEFTTVTDDGVRFWFEDKLVIDVWRNQAPAPYSFKGNLEKGKLYKIKMEYYEDGGGASAILGWKNAKDDLINDAVALAKKSDAVILFVGTSYQIETEGKDRDDLFLPGGQDMLIEKVLEVNKNVIVVISSGAPIVMNRWIEKVNGIVEMWFGGNEGGNAIADVLLGNYNPSGKLPATFPKRWEDCSAYSTYKSFPARTYYADDIYVGYRHFDKNKIEPLFPFGFGLSYTTFGYSNLKVDNSGYMTSVSFDLTNSGKIKGEEVAQLYLSALDSRVDRPVKELKAFKKVELNPGETKNVKLVVRQSDFGYFDEESNSWKIDNGKFEIGVGASSRDIKLKETITIK